jgi:predicted  nucleic acid-binding Zn-ribbon protein
MIDSLPAGAWTAAIAIVGALIGWATTRSKNQADVTSVLSETSIKWIGELRSETQRLRDQIVELEAEISANEETIAHLKAQYERLVSWLRAQGLEFPGEHETD